MGRHISENREEKEKNGDRKLGITVLEVAAPKVEFVGIGEKGGLADQVILEEPEPVVGLEVVPGHQGQQFGIFFRKQDIGDGFREVLDQRVGGEEGDQAVTHRDDQPFPPEPVLGVVPHGLLEPLEDLPQDFPKPAGKGQVEFPLLRIDHLVAHGLDRRIFLKDLETEPAEAAGDVFFGKVGQFEQ